MQSPKRHQVKTERMQEYLRAQAEQSSPTKRLQCPEEGCNKVLTSSPGLRYHLKSHYQDRPYMCLRCNKRFKSANGLKYHTERTKCQIFHHDDRSSSPIFIDESTDNSLSPWKPSISPTSSAIRCLNPSLECFEGPDSLPEEDYNCPVIRMQHQLPGLFRPRLCIQQQKTGFQVSARAIDSIPSSSSVAVKELTTKPKEIVAISPDSTNPSSSLSSSPPLGNHSSSPLDALTELAIIATGPQSPLIRNNPTRNLKDESDDYVTSSSPCPTSPKNGGWSHRWPTAVWQCFMKGSRVRFTSGSNMDWQLAEDVGFKESMSNSASQNPAQLTRYAPNGLRILRIEDCQMFLRLRFTTDIPTASELIVECRQDHPFFIKDKGWASFQPSATAENYGIPCNELEKNDICLPPSHPEATFTLDVFQTLKSYDLSPQDSSAVLTLSCMAKQKRDQELASPVKSVPSTTPTKPKRPMNAFMIFARKSRMAYTHQHPGKDNRTISVLLGEAWKKMSASDREFYNMEAAALAEQKKHDNLIAAHNQ
ncbi:HMG box-containing protein 1-like [Tubulanus polymorphus]|uniref:HMG box-containing protein 1-like n=1 Tax=Tubulanus polymorphus TaxID=672921 RepID=UPI003DA681C1